MTYADCQPLPREFYLRDTIEVARSILGKVLVHRVLECGSDSGSFRFGTKAEAPRVASALQRIIAGRIVEAEAYTSNDPSCHACRGMTKRNAQMFGPPGHAYIYFTYGMYFCLNAVTAPEGTGEAVLIRAAEPLEGIDLMVRNRGTDVLTNLASGPGKLCKAFGLDKRQNGLDLTGSDLTIVDDGFVPGEIVTTTRIGIRLATDRPWRFYLKGNPHMSRK